MQSLEAAIRECEESKPGSVPGELKAAVNFRLRPQPDPWDLLRGAVARAASSVVGAPDYTLRRMSRRQQQDGPRLRGVQRLTPQVVVILDTSGSMTWGKRADRALDVIAKGLRRCRSVKVVCYDTRLHSRANVSSMQNFKWSGGGGTSMAAAIQQVEKEDRPDTILIVTDCETGWPSRKGRANVVVADVAGTSHDRVPGFYKKINLSREGGDR
jgi:predicted metal-dependent peptidase